MSFTTIPKKEQDKTMENKTGKIILETAFLQILFYSLFPCLSRKSSSRLIIKISMFHRTNSLEGP